MNVLTFIDLYYDGNPMGWDGTGVKCYEVGWDATEKNVPWMRQKKALQCIVVKLVTKKRNQFVSIMRIGQDSRSRLENTSDSESTKVIKFLLLDFASYRCC